MNKSDVPNWLFYFWIAVVLAFGLGASRVQAAPTYRVTVIPNGKAHGLNNRGDLLIQNALGVRVDQGYGPAAGAIGARYPSLTYSSSSFNSAGQVAADTRIASPAEPGKVEWQAAIIDPQGLRALGTLGGPNSTAQGINEAGTVVGASYTTAGTPHAFIESGSGMRDLGTLPGARFSFAEDVNASGVAVGYSGEPDLTSYGSLFQEHMYPSGLWDGLRAVRFADGRVEDLGTLGGNSSVAEAINDDGVIIGTSKLAGGNTHAFLYRDGRMTDLGSPAPKDADLRLVTELQELGVTDVSLLDGSYGQDINQAGQVVGYFWRDAQGIGPDGKAQGLGSTDRGFLFEAGKMYDLNDLLEPGSPAINIGWATAINDLGQILADGSGLGLVHGSVVLTPTHLVPPTYPIPEPATWLVLGLSFVGVIAWHRSRCSAGTKPPLSGEAGGSPTNAPSRLD